MNLHLIQDTVFLNDFVDLVSETGFLNNNHFYVYYSTSDKNGEYKHLKKEKFEKTKILNCKLDDLHLQANAYKNVFIHYLSDDLWGFISKLNSKTILVWCTWGSDFYCPDELFSHILFDEKSREVFDNETLKHITDFISTHPPKSPVKRFVYNLTRLIIPNYRINRSLSLHKKQWDSYLKRKQEILKKVNYLLNYGSEDYEFIKENYKISPIYLPFYYTTFTESKIDIGLSPLLLKYGIQPTDKTIFIGNCGDLHNNHLDLIPQLQRVKKRYSNVKFIVPLSYGTQKYIDFISTIYRKEFEETFIPIYEFIKKQEYYQLLNSIDVMIMNHNINMGGTNLFKAIFFGKKIYVKRNNPLVVHLQKYAVQFIYVEELGRNDYIDLFTPLSNEAILNNKNGILSAFSNEKAIKNLQLIFSSIEA